MAVSLALGGLADQPGGPFLNELNGAVRAITTFSASSSEPPVYDQCMAWFDLNTNHFKVRNPQNTAWVSVFRITATGSVPLIQGVDTAPLASLASALAAAGTADGFLKRNANGAIVVATMESPDLPTFGVGRSGMVPGVTAAQLDANAALRAQGWKLGQTLVGERVFAGAQDYALALPQADRYQASVRVAMSNAQPLFLQVGNGGSPRQSGYQCAVSRSWVDVNPGEESLRSTSVRQSQPETTTAGFQLWRTHGGITQMFIDGSLVNMGGGQWCWQSSGGAITGGLDGDVSRGDVTLTGGTLDYIRVISAGDPRGTFSSRASINTGKIRVFAA